MRLQWLPERLIAKLRDAGIMLIPDKEPSFLVRGSALKKVTIALGAKSVLLAPTEVRGLKEALFQIEAPRVERAEIEICDCYKRHSAFSSAALTDIVRESIGQFAAKIVVHDREGETYTADKNGTFQIVVYGSPNKRNADETPERIWGIDEYFSDDPKLPTRQGIPIRSGTYVVAELFPGEALYVMHRVTDDDCADDRKIVRRLMQTVASLLQFSPQDLAELQARSLQTYETLMAQKYAETCVECADEARDQLDGLIADRAREVAEARGSYIRELRALEALRRRRMKKQDLKALRIKKVAEFQKLSEFHGVNAVRLEGDYLAIETQPIICTNPRTKSRHLMGRYIIKVPFDSFDSENDVNILNLDGTHDGFHHPHVNGDGWPCLGNIDSAVAECLGTGDVPTLVTLMVAYLETMNPDDDNAGDLRHWPEAPKEEPAAQQPCARTEGEVAHV